MFDPQLVPAGSMYSLVRGVQICSRKNPNPPTRPRNTRTMQFEVLNYEFFPFAHDSKPWRPTGTTSVGNESYRCPAPFAILQDLDIFWKHKVSTNHKLGKQIGNNRMAVCRNFASNFWKSLRGRFSWIFGILCTSRGYQDLLLGFYQTFAVIYLAIYNIRNPLYRSMNLQYPITSYKALLVSVESLQHFCRVQDIFLQFPIISFMDWLHFLRHNWTLSSHFARILGQDFHYTSPRAFQTYQDPQTSFKTLCFRDQYFEKHKNMKAHDI